MQTAAMSKLFQLDLFAQAMLAGSLIEAQPQTDPKQKAPIPPDKRPGMPPSNTPPAAPPQPAASPLAGLGGGGRNYRLTGERDLATTWSARASDNLAAMRLALEIVAEGRPATEAEQAKLIRFVGFGASKIATSLFPVGNKGFRAGWETLGTELHELVDARDFAALARSTQYAHYTPEFIVRAFWKAVGRLGFSGGMILEPGIGTGLFLALAPQAIADRSYLTGFEFDPTTARIAQLLHPQADIHACDFSAPDLDIGGPYDLAIGNPPFSDRQVSAGSGLRLSLHEYFIWKAVRNLQSRRARRLRGQPLPDGQDRHRCALGDRRRGRPDRRHPHARGLNALARRHRCGGRSAVLAAAGRERRRIISRRPGSALRTCPPHMAPRRSRSIAISR